MSLFCYLVVRFLFIACLLYTRKKVKLFLKLESNSLAIYNSLESGANKTCGDVFQGTHVIELVDFF